MMDPVWRPTILTVFGAFNESMDPRNVYQIIRLQSAATARGGVPRGTSGLDALDSSSGDPILQSRRPKLRELRMQRGHDELHGLRGDLRNQSSQPLVIQFS